MTKKLRCFFPLLAFTVCAIAQDVPTAPETKPARPFKFVDRKTGLLLASSAITLSTDALSSLKVQAYNFHYSSGAQALPEPNPIARPFVQHRWSTGLYFGGAFALETAGVAFADKKHWHKAKWLIPLTVSAWEGFLTWNNYRYVHNQSAANNCYIHGLNPSQCHP